MMKIFGKVLDANLNNGIQKPNAACVEECYQQSDCILVFMNSAEQCLSFGINISQKLTVVETTKEDKLFVAFKTQFSLSQCPAYKAMDLTVTVGTETVPWIKNGSEYTFKRCLEDWKMFERKNNVVVCMQTFVINVTRFEAAKQECEGKGPYKLTGLQTVEELNWVYGFWIGAKRQEAYSGQEITEFDFFDGYTVLDKEFYTTNCLCGGKKASNAMTEDCMIVCKTFDGHLRMNDDSCESTINGLGVVCGYRLL
ncbi:hypothetical protein GCK72_012517 [Caenorhabditis remanei]|uniref:PAN-3 domain-containing protein n=1 Tax=Caenorhabditis remanei TaxID=31234 RepID=A0A6A5GN33_CAERE|nr:hypothetical protein GCK72_012517 [Caenorhabditis remanei]KAF1756064.1 hypothetical protein GCK72_012517 [Caenorhabditis remanei]